MQTSDISVKRNRTFLPQDFKIDTWPNLEIFYKLLLTSPVNSADELKEWLNKRSELESVVSEELGWRYIRMSCETDSAEYRDSFNSFIQDIEPNIAPISNELDEKVLNCTFTKELTYSGDTIMVRAIETSFKIFREKNIPLQTEQSTRQQEYGAITGAMTVELHGKELTLQQAGVELQSTDRQVRETVYRLINERRLADKPQLDDLFKILVKLRNQIAQNADFNNYRDYMFEAMGRYDYTPQDCFDFHKAIAKTVVPVLEEFQQQRKDHLGYADLRPWDLSVDPENKPALKPFEGGEDLLSKTISCFDRLDPFLGDCLRTMKEMKHLDLVSRKGKAPGGYNYPLDESGVPFIFMNATSTLQDMITMLHEGGHAIHSIVTKELPLYAHRNLTSEIAELASMSMELISMDHWDIFFPDKETLRRAKIQHLEHVIETLPWVATIDKFQHWIYENPHYTQTEITAAWLEIQSTFSGSVINWGGLEKYRENVWQKQLHLYEVPFYYVEYGIAQLGAIAVWKNFKENPKSGLDNYLNALKLGYTKDIKLIYEAAGIKFDFSEGYITKLIDFVKKELLILQQT